jgi:flagellar protein FlaJ
VNIKKNKFEFEFKQKVYIASILIASALILFGILSESSGILGNLILISILILIIPHFYFRYQRFRELREMEERFPDFIRDLVDVLASGLPLHEAIKNVSKINYGALSKEIKKMARQLSWGVNINKVLDGFAERVKENKRLASAIKIIKEANFSGGELIPTLESLAEDSVLLKESEKQRKAMMHQYLLLMYGISFIFIAIIVAMNYLLVPLFQTSAAFAEMGLSDPCSVCSGLGCEICSFYSFITTLILRREEIQSYYLGMFFLISMLQSFFAGMVAGYIVEKSFLNGIKHGLILLVITWAIFLVLGQIRVI